MITSSVAAQLLVHGYSAWLQGTVPGTWVQCLVTGLFAVIVEFAVLFHNVLNFPHSYHLYPHLYTLQQLINDPYMSHRHYKLSPLKVHYH